MKQQKQFTNTVKVLEWRNVIGTIDEVRGGWRKWCNEELHNLYSLRNISLVIKWKLLEVNGTCSWHGGIRNAYKSLDEKSKGNRPLTRYRCQYKGNFNASVKSRLWTCEWDATNLESILSTPILSTPFHTCHFFLVIFRRESTIHMFFKRVHLGMFNTWNKLA